jgi:hypothetical protein
MKDYAHRQVLWCVYCNLKFLFRSSVGFSISYICNRFLICDALGSCARTLVTITITMMCVYVRVLRALTHSRLYFYPPQPLQAPNAP